MTVNDLMWKVLANADDEAEVVAMTIAIKEKNGSIALYGVDDYGCWFEK